MNLYRSLYSRQTRGNVPDNRYLEKLAAGIPPSSGTQAPIAAHPPQPAGFGTVAPAPVSQPQPAGFGNLLTAPQPLQPSPAGLVQVQAQQTSAGFGVVLGGAPQRPTSLLAPASEIADVLGSWGAPVTAGGGTDLLGPSGPTAPKLMGDLLGAVPPDGSPASSAQSGGRQSSSSREIVLTQLRAEDFTMDESPRRGAMPGGAAHAQQQSIMKFISSLGVDPAVRLAYCRYRIEFACDVCCAGTDGGLGEFLQHFKRCMDGLSKAELLLIGDGFKQEAARRH